MSPMNPDPLVSVILPVYNGAEFLGSALESALSQTYRHLEIIAIDDGSTDGTPAVLDLYALKDSRIRVLTQANAGVARARNRGIAEAHGNFIAPLDADDLWEPTKIERQLQRMLAAGNDTGFVYSWWVWIDASGGVLDRSPRWMFEGHTFDSLLQINFSGNASVPLFRRHCVEEAGGYNEQLAATGAGGCEDWELVLRVAERYQAAVVPEILLGYRRRPGSMSNSCDTMWRSQQRVVRAMRELRPDLDARVPRRAAHQFAMYLAGLCFWSGNMVAAFRWGLRSGCRLPFLIAPHVIRMLLSRNRRKPVLQTMRPGVALDTHCIPEPLLPYDRIPTLRPLTGTRLISDKEPHSHLVSVVIPAYNAEATIADTLRSVRSQTHHELEIIVVDDGSTDRTTSVVKAHAAVDGRVSLIEQENSGVAAARNAGWQSARSAFIAFVDADDLWAPTKIERQLDILLRGGLRVGLVYTWWALIDEHNRIRCKVRGRDIAGDVLEQTLMGNFVGHASSALIRRQALVETGGFDSGLRDAGIHGCEDMLIYHRIARRYHFGLVPDHLTGYRVASDRMSNDRPRMLRSYKMVANEMKLGHPESAEKVDRGTRMYLVFLIGEALGSRNFRQVFPLLTLWVPEHPLDGLIIPFSVFSLKVGNYLHWMGKALLGHGFAKEPFPIGKLDRSTRASIVENGEFMKNR